VSSIAVIIESICCRLGTGGEENKNEFYQKEFPASSVIPTLG
jgi:hypothetical protein